MKSEAAKGILRIASNYVRLGGNLALGLILVPFMLRWVKNDALSVVTLLGAGTGFAAMFREITDRAVIRELASAHHTDDPAHFRTVFNSALVVSTGAAGIVLLLFVALFFAVHAHLLNIRPELMGAAYVLILTQAIVMTYATACSPLFNMQVVTERFVLYNFWTLADRASFLGAAIVVRYVMHVTDPAQAVIRWTITTTVLELIAITIPLLVLMSRDARLRPTTSLIRRDATRAVFGTIRWYVAVEISNNLYDRAGFIFSNVSIGARGNLVYGLGQQFVNYIGQVAWGISMGLDSISARMESKSGRSLPVLLHHSTRLLALASIPVGVLFIALAPQLVQLWVGRTIENPGENVPRIATTIQIMAPAVTIRAVATGLTTILYGAGFLRRYAPLLLTGGVCNVVLTTLALLTARHSPELWRQYLIPGVMVVVNSTVYGLLLPRTAAQCLGVRYRDVFRPVVRPLLATALCSPVLVLAPWAMSRLGLTWSIAAVLTLGMAFGSIYAVVSCLLVLEDQERERFLWSPVRRFIHGRAGHEPPSR